MPSSLTRQEASRVLGVPATADDRVVKQAYRRLARVHHPDRGGDPGTFHRLRIAYERLVQDEVSAGPDVARGRPSRPPAPFDDQLRRADVGSVSWDTIATTEAGRLDRDRLANLLVQAAPVARITATSRAPGSRLNRVAAALSPAFTSWLTIAPARDDRGQTVVRIELSANGRRTRQALDRVTLGDAWTRTRRSTSTRLHAALTPSPEPRSTAVRAADLVRALLDELRWPLGEWTPTDEGP